MYDLLAAIYSSNALVWLEARQGMLERRERVLTKRELKYGT